MGVSRIMAGTVAFAAGLAAFPAFSQFNNEPYSYRNGGGTGMSTAYRQAMIDQHLTGNRPRTLLRGPDGSLVTVTEKDGQAFLSTPQPNYLVNRNGTAAGISFSLGGVGLASSVDNWTGTVVGVVPPGAQGSPIGAWTAQVDGVRPVP